MNINVSATMDGSVVLGSGDIMLVCALGVGIVFAGLVCIVLLCTILSKVMKLFGEKEEAAPAAVAAPVAAPTSAANDLPANRQEFVAAVSAAIAQQMGKDVSAIRIVSIKRV